MANEADHIFDELEDSIAKNAKAIESLSEYTFKLGIQNSAIELTIPLSDEESVNQTDFLYFLENGSMPHGIIATRPIEKTMQMMQNEISSAYKDCIDGMNLHAWKDADIQRRLSRCCRLMSQALKNVTDSKIRSVMTCTLWHFERKLA